MAWNRNIGLFIFFTALLSIKVSTFHVYCHTDNDCDRIENCEYCELAIENQNTEYVMPLLGVLDVSNLVFLRLELNYDPYFSTVSDSVVTKNHCRPPPDIA